jgi:hypothetical protein
LGPWVLIRESWYYIYDVVQGYVAGKRDYPKWVLIPSDLHTPGDAARMLNTPRG